MIFFEPFCVDLLEAETIMYMCPPLAKGEKQNIIVYTFSPLAKGKKMYIIMPNLDVSAPDQAKDIIHAIMENIL